MTRARLAACLCLLLMAASVATSAAAQDKRKPAAAAKRQPRAKTSVRSSDSPPSAAAPQRRGRAARPKAQPAAPAREETASPQPSAAGEASAAPRHAEPKAPASSANALADVDADENVKKEGGTDVKTLEFGGLDIEGQLKTPQMLYFLNRLRAEFDRPQLPHRSFIPELQRSTKENAF